MATVQASSLSATHTSCLLVYLLHLGRQRSCLPVRRDRRLGKRTLEPEETEVRYLKLWKKNEQTNKKREVMEDDKITQTHLKKDSN